MLILHAVINSFSTEDEVVYRGAMEQCIIYERENPSYYQRRNLKIFYNLFVHIDCKFFNVCICIISYCLLHVLLVGTNKGYYNIIIVKGNIKSSDTEREDSLQM